LLYFQGHFKFPNPKKWTDEELGIPPEDEWTFIFYVVISISALLWRVNTMIDWLVFYACFSSISALLWRVNTMIDWLGLMPALAVFQPMPQ
jgi:hypothetical protein